MTGQRIEHALFRGELGLALDILAQPLARHDQRHLDQIAHDLLDIAADIADFGEFGRFDLDERRLRQLGEAPRDLGLADTGRADHQDVLRQNLLAQLFGKLLSPPAIAQSDRDGAFGVGLADNVTIEFGDDFTR